MTEFTRRAQDHDSHTCAYDNAGQRCRYPDAISLGTTGGGPWYCRVHARERRTLFAQQTLEQSQTYRPPFESNDDLKDLTWLNENFPMLPSETRQDYNQRCRAKALGMLKGFRVKPLLNTEPPRIREPGEDLVEL